MSCKRPDVAQGLKRMKTETDKEIVASYEVNRRIKLSDGRGARKDGNKGKVRCKKREGTKGRRKKGCTNALSCKNLCEEKR